MTPRDFVYHYGRMWSFYEKPAKMLDRAFRHLNTSWVDKELQKVHKVTTVWIYFLLLRMPSESIFRVARALEVERLRLPAQQHIKYQ